MIVFFAFSEAFCQHGSRAMGGKKKAPSGATQNKGTAGRKNPIHSFRIDCTAFRLACKGKYDKNEKIASCRGENRSN